MPEISILLAFFKAMSNESRLRMVGLLSGAERSVQELAELLDLKEPTVSHHLAVLKELGLVTVRAAGTTRWHTLDGEALEAMNRAMLEPPETPEPAESWEDKVLAAFVGADGALKVIPASRRKRTVVLKWLVAQFDEGRRYREAEVNEAIQRRHWDSATLRRELVGAGMMARADNVYWRLPEGDWRLG